MLDERKKKILQAIIEEYINTAEPVSSGVIVENYDLNCSSATIRNEMAELEHLGYIEKPHTSSGRVPSAKGYRFYVDELLNDEKISLDEIQYIKERLEFKVNEIQDLTKITTNTLSEITHYTTVAIGPDNTDDIISDVKLVLLGNRILMAVILTESGAIKETIIKYDEDITENQLESLNYLFNNKLKGEPLTKIDKPMEARNFLSILDTKEQVMEILNSGFADDINIHIGSENDREELRDLSIITFKHMIGNKNFGTIGIIGPKRMDYSKVISVMKYINKKLNEELNDNDTEN